MRYFPLAVLALGVSCASADDVGDLVRKLPHAANTLTVVRVESLLGSDRAQAERWHETQQERYLSNVAVIPPWVETLVIASLVHPAVPEEVWSAALVRRPEDVTLEALAQREGATIEPLGGVPAVHCRRDSFLAQPLPNLLAVYRPAHRLEASRWFRAISEGVDTTMSPYLVEASQRPDHLVLAMDLRDLLDPQQVERYLMEDERFAANRQLVERLVPLISELRGVTLTANVTDTTQARVMIDFSEDVGRSSLTAKTLFVAILDDLGAAIDEFAGAKVTSSGSSVTLSCQLSDESFRRILSLIVTPATPYRPVPALKPPAPDSLPERAQAVDTKKATTKYIEAIDKMIDDLQRANRRAKDYARTAAWHDNFARKILELPTEGVDPAAVNYGFDVASKFRALGASLRGQAVEINAEQQSLTYNAQYTPGWASLNVWGGVGYGEPAYNVQSNLREVRERQAAAIAQGTKDREQIWLMIEEERSKARRLVSDAGK